MPDQGRVQVLGPGALAMRPARRPSSTLIGLVADVAIAQLRFRATTSALNATWKLGRRWHGLPEVVLGYQVLPAPRGGWTNLGVIIIRRPSG